MDRAGLSARQIADHLGHSKISMTQDRYLGRRAVGDEAAEVLDRVHREVKADYDRRVSGP
jgi:integrase